MRRRRKKGDTEWKFAAELLRIRRQGWRDSRRNEVLVL
jgi:hypothetical protein